MLIGDLIMRLVGIYYYVLIAAILMTWVPDVTRTGVGRLLTRITEPYFAPFRKWIPPLRMGVGAVDFSPVVALIAYYFIEIAIRQVLLYLNL